MKTFRLICMAPDGAFVREGEHKTVSDAWNRFNDMGSRWVFYPVSFVTGSSCSDLARVLDAPSQFSWAKGLSLRSVARHFSTNSQEICDLLNNK